MANQRAKNTGYQEQIVERETVIAQRYLVLSTLGAGQTGIVYEVADEQLGGERIALKLLHPHLLQDEATAQRVKKEVFLIRQLNHPNIVRIYDIELRKGGHQFITMELVTGRSLRQIIEKLPRPFSEDEVRSIIAQLLAALNLAHSKGIVHRDLKPENILIEYTGIVKLGDFGCLQDDSNQRLTKTGQLVGTPAYMAPEQFEASSVSAGADLYSVGIIAYELMTGVPPFRDTSLYELAKSHTTKMPVLEEVQKNYSNSLQLFVNSSLVKLVDQRLESAAQGMKILEISDPEKQTAVLADLLREYFFDSRESLSSKRRSRVSNMLILSFTFIVSAISIFNTALHSATSADLIRLERFYDLNFDFARKHLGFTPIRLKETETIHQAIRNNDLVALETWCRTGVINIGRTSNGETLVHTFIRNPRAMIHVIDLPWELCIPPDLFDRPDQNGEQAVIHAIRFGHVTGLRTLVEKGFSTNVYDRNGISALELAASSGNPLLVYALFAKSGGKFTVSPEDAAKVMLNAAKSGQLQVVKKLLSIEVGRNVRDAAGRNLLMVAAMGNPRNIEEITDLLISYGVSCFANDDKKKNVESYFSENVANIPKSLSECLKAQKNDDARA